MALLALVQYYAHGDLHAQLQACCYALPHSNRLGGILVAEGPSPYLVPKKKPIQEGQVRDDLPGSHVWGTLVTISRFGARVHIGSPPEMTPYTTWLGISSRGAVYGSVGTRPNPGCFPPETGLPSSPIIYIIRLCARAMHLSTRRSRSNE